MTAEPNIVTLTIAGRLPANDLIDLASAGKEFNWEVKGMDQYRTRNGSCSLIVVATVPAGESAESLVSQVWNLVPNLDGVVMTEAELEIFSGFKLEDDEDDQPDKKWW